MGEPDLSGQLPDAGCRDGDLATSAGAMRVLSVRLTESGDGESPVSQVGRGGALVRRRMCVRPPQAS